MAHSTVALNIENNSKCHSSVATNAPTQSNPGQEKRKHLHKNNFFCSKDDQRYIGGLYFGNHSDDQLLASIFCFPPFQPCKALEGNPWTRLFFPGKTDRWTGRRLLSGSNWNAWNSCGHLLYIFTHLLLWQTLGNWVTPMYLLLG